MLREGARKIMWVAAIEAAAVRNLSTGAFDSNPAWPDTDQQRCWVRKTANVMEKLPQGHMQPKVNPTENWQHIRTTNSVELIFATVIG